MVGSYDRFADADAGQTLKATGQVLDDPIHDPPSIEGAGVLAGAIDLGGAHYDDLGVANLLLKRFGVRGEDLVEGEIGEFGDSGFDKFLAGRQIREELPVDRRTKLAFRGDDRERAACPRQQRRHPYRSDRRKGSNCGTNGDLSGLGKPSNKLLAHFVAHRINEQVGDPRKSLQGQFGAAGAERRAGQRSARPNTGSTSLRT
jgi:hypothetical protein